MLEAFYQAASLSDAGGKMGSLFLNGLNTFCEAALGYFPQSGEHDPVLDEDNQ
ncbi:hypothetical protein [Thiothrix caldifontis]|uniref:hypothetical protein n=1 Tax=Thiothrix caldifontis TaxID=525918 RepID=UPI00158752D1|nr:hypothetical protein [Thiothrix caldifontis]